MRVLLGVAAAAFGVLACEGRHAARSDGAQPPADAAPADAPSPPPDAAPDARTCPPLEPASANAALSFRDRGPFAESIAAIVLHPASPDDVFAEIEVTRRSSGSVGAVPVRSEDGGRTWWRMQRSATPDPAVSGRLLAPGHDGVYASRDHGATWTRIALPDRDLDRIVGHPRAPGTFFATFHATAWDTPGAPAVLARSLDGGATWTELLLAETGLFSGETLVAFDPPTLHLLDFNKLYRSDDLGATRTLESEEVPGSTWNATVQAAAGAVYLASGFSAGIQRFRQGQWAQIGPAGSRALALDPGRPGRLHAVGDSALLRSEDGGDSFTTIGPVTEPQAVAALGQRIYVGTATGLLASDDGGASLRRLPIDAVPLEIERVAADPAWPDRVFAFTADGAFRSDDGGEHWRTVRRGLSANVYGVAFDGTRRARIYLATDAGVQRSDDEGLTFEYTSLLFSSTRAIAIDPRAPDTLFAATNSGVFRSGDGGASFAAPRGDTSTTLVALAIDAGGTLWAGGFEGLLRSADDGATFEIVSRTPVTALVARGLDVFASTDASVTRWPCPEAPGPAGVVALALGPDGGLRAASANGLFRRHGPGHWRLEQVGEPSSLASDGVRLYLGTPGGVRVGR